MTEWKQLSGEALSFNNYLDIGSAYEIIDGFEDRPTAATVKHGQISGFAFAATLARAYSLAHACDPEADFGGTVVLNRRVDEEAAKLIGKNEGEEDGSVYTEIVIAPGYDEPAIDVLRSKQKKKIRMIQTGKERPDYRYDMKELEGAVLLQEPADYRKRLDARRLEFPTTAKPDQATLQKLLAAWEVVRRVQSNGIVVADGSVSPLFTLRGREAGRALDARRSQLQETQRGGEDRPRQRREVGRGSRVRLRWVLPIP